MTNRLDLVTVGRSSVDLYGEQAGGLLEDVASFAKYVGGSPTNTAFGSARLGLEAGLVTRVGADHMGRFITEELRGAGVDVSGVIADADRLTALVLLGIRDQDNFPLIFYRENCADMALCSADLDREWIESAGAVLINGTHLSTDTVFEASVTAAQWCKEAGGRVVFDVDYRPVLWGLTERDMGENRFVAHDEVTARLQKVLPLCDLIVGTEEEIHILGGSTDTIDALLRIRAVSDALIVCKRGPLGCAAFDGKIPDSLDEGIRGDSFRVDVFNVLGAGDAFMAGFLRGWLRGEAVERCCTWGNACGALVVSRHGCAPAMPTWPELQFFLKQKKRPFRPRDDAELEALHWSTTRKRDFSDLTILAIDHRSQFEDLAEETGADPARISRFKELALAALDRVADDKGDFGILADGRYGQDVLAQAADRPYWIGRPVELPRSRPLEFEGGASLANELREWPLPHVVKCLVFYHPDEEHGLRDAQEAQLRRLFAAARGTRHELLLEIILPDGTPADDDTVARAIRRVYEIGVRPDWWKLEPQSTAAAWQHIENAVKEGDANCRGILLLGLSSPMDELIASFSAAAASPLVRGFAVGRTVFYDVARQWMAGEIDDEAAQAALAERLSTLVRAWRKACGHARQERVA